MSNGWVGYHPQRIVTLLARAVEAVVELERLRSDAPEAEDALRTVRTVRLHLEGGLLTLVERIVRSDVLLAPTPVTRLSFVVADEMVEHARDVLDGDGDALDELRALLARDAGDPWAMRAFFAELGGNGLADLLMVLGSQFDPDDGAALAVAIALRRSLGEVSTMLGMASATFADELFERCVERRNDDGVNAAATLSFVLRSGYLSTDLRAGFARAVLDHERASREGEAVAWPLGLSGTVLNREVSDDVLWSVDDPRYAAMHSLAGDGDAARQIFTDPALVDELVTGRTWEDGLRSLLAAGAAASQVPADARPDVREQAAAAATQLVNRVGSADLLLDGAVDPDAAESAAAVLSVHMLAVQGSISLGNGDPSPDELDDLQLPTLYEDSFGPEFEMTTALFGAAALSRFTSLAASSDEGVITLRAGLSNYQAGRADGTARVLADDIPGDRNQYLEDAMWQSGELEGYFIQHIGHEAERQGRSKDSRIELWIDIGTLSLRRGEDSIEDWTMVDIPFLSDALRPAAADAKQAWADHEDAAERAASAGADAASHQLTYRYLEALVEHGVVEPPAGMTSLPSLAEFEQLPEVQRMDIWNELVERPDRDVEDVSPNGSEVERAIKSQQLAIYQEFDQEFSQEPE